MKSKLMVGTILSLALAASTAFAAEKVALCHATGSDNNPFRLIHVSVNGLNGHDLHDGDFLLPEGQNECEGGGPLPE